MTLDRELHNLMMIGSVPPGGKLMHDDGKLYVQDASPLNCVFRWIHKEGRDRTLRTVREVLASAHERVVDMADSRSSSDATPYRLAALHRAMEACVGGMRNLQTTYISDASTQAGLDLLLHRAAGIIDRLDQLRTSLR